MRKDIVQNWASQNNLIISEEQFNKLEALQRAVIETNKKMNLTTITNNEDFAVKHIIDSMTILNYIPKDATVLDIGTGAGFPGIVLGIMRPDIALTLLDSLKKRVQFLKQTLDMLGMGETVKCIPERAEDLAASNIQYDVCTARAVAKMKVLAKYALPLVKPGGVLLAMKGRDTTDELDEAKYVLKKLGGIVKSVDIVNLTEEIRHSIVVVKREQ